MTEVIILIDVLARLGVLSLGVLSALHREPGLSEETRAELWKRIEARSKAIDDRAMDHGEHPLDHIDGTPV